MAMAPIIAVPGSPETGCFHQQMIVHFCDIHHFHLLMCSRVMYPHVEFAERDLSESKYSLVELLSGRKVSSYCWR